MQLGSLSGWFPLIVSLLALVVTYRLLTRRSHPRPAPPVQAKPPKQKLSIHGTRLVQPNTLNTLTNLTVDFDVYLVFLVPDDPSEQLIRSQLSSLPIPSHHLLFCETPRGLQACIRHLNSRLHIESDLSLACSLKPVMNQIVMVTTDQCEGFLQLVQLEDSERFLCSVLGEDRN